MRKILWLLLAIVFFTETTKAQLPDFTQTDINGVTHNLYDDLAAGNAVVLKFCAVWCAPCAISNPEFQKAWEILGAGNCKVKMYSVLYQDGNYQNTDVNDGISYADKYKLTMPMLTNIDYSLIEQFFLQYNIEAIPTTLVILPNQQNPASSTAEKIVGADPDLAQLIVEKLALGGSYTPNFKITGNLCSDPPHTATLSSHLASGNLWSTGETTQSITVTQNGTYSLSYAEGGCVGNSTQIVEFEAPFTVGTASTLNSSICHGGRAMLTYSLPPGSPADVQWLRQFPGEDRWRTFSPANEGPVFFDAYSTNSAYAPGAEIKFKVRAKGGNHSSCEQFSNELTITISTDQPSVLEGTATASSTTVCKGSDFILTYTGGLPDSRWQIFHPYLYRWDDYGPADQPLTTKGNAHFGITADYFRVKSFTDECYSLSNTVQVNYHNSTPQITGPTVTCGNTDITLQLNANSTDIQWSTGASTPSITVAPSATTNYSVTATNESGCVFTDNHSIRLWSNLYPVIEATTNGVVCPGGAVTLRFAGTNSASPCTTAATGQWPENTYSLSDCSGMAEVITAEGYLSEYSLLNVEEGKYYKFTSSSENYYGEIIITIASADGLEVYASGTFSTIWKATVTGPVRFYTHGPDCMGSEFVLINRLAACFAEASSLGSFFWMPGGQTTPSITVTPGATTNYTLTFTQAGEPCPSSATKQVTVGIENVSLLTPPVYTYNSAAEKYNATFRWEAAIDPVQWQIEYKSTKPGSKWTRVTVASASDRSASTGYVLSANQRYMWHIRARCGKALTANSESVTFTTPPTGAQNLTSTNSIKDVVNEEGTSASTLRLYPNPSRGQFMVSLHTQDVQTTTAKIRLLDASGRTLLVDNAVVSGGRLQKILTVPATAAKGLYRVQILVNNTFYAATLLYTK